MTLKLGPLELGAPAVAVSFTDVDSREDMAAARLAGVAIAELRIDHFARHDADYVTAQIGRLAGLPTLATIRMAEEGGEWRDGEAARLALFKTILPLVDGVDVELRARETLAALAPEAHASGKLLVVSHHDFERTPPYEDLAEIARRAVRAGGDVVKIAAQVHGPDDVVTLAQLLEERPAPNLVVIGMGEAGLSTRLEFPALGSLFTFAAMGNRTSAPGQLSYWETLKRLSPSV